MAARQAQDQAMVTRISNQDLSSREPQDRAERQEHPEIPEIQETQENQVIRACLDPVARAPEVDRAAVDRADRVAQAAQADRAAAAVLAARARSIRRKEVHRSVHLFLL